jgi:putative SOS response-associated peptidase YedK
MCGRYTLHHDKKALEEHFKVGFGPLHPRYNLAPAERIKFIFSNANERRQAGSARWGLVPHWSKTGTTEVPLFNARRETVLQKPAFRDAFVRGRCLVPASGWYEWKRDEDGKRPYHLRLETGEPFAFAGLFDVWRGEEGERLVSCTVLTTAASKELSWLHERMPVIMDYDHYDRWLDRSTPDIADLTELLMSYPAAGLVVYPVSPKVNRASMDAPELLEAMGSARTGVRPGTTEKIEIPASKYLAFKAEETLKDELG